MRHFPVAFKSVLLISAVLCTAVYASAQESNTEITGFYQQYRDFSFNTGIPDLDFPATKLTGGGFTLAQNLAPWFALWTQFSFYGSIEQPAGLKVRIINNSQGPRWQTRYYGPIRLYVKGGVGFSHFSVEIPGIGSGGETKLSLTYGGGAQIKIAEWLGITLDASHVLMGVPNLTDLEGRDKWDSGLTLTPGLTISF